jgi:hypothetical protein
MDRLLRVIRLLTSAYDFVWALIFVIGGVTVAIAGGVADRLPMVAVGIGIAVLGLAWLTLDVWPSRRAE